ncbi:MAG: hypothetical protein WCY55_02895 [Anaerovoracaceae bacterium]
MRITNRMVTNQFIRSLNDMSLEMNRLNMQVITGRKFSRSSENTSAAVKGFRIRKDLSRADSYLQNIDHAKASLGDAESALTHINALMNTAEERILAGLNGTMSRETRSILAEELSHLQEQLYQTLNSSTAGSYYFGGTNTKVKPFSIGDDGKLVYNQAVLRDLTSAAADALAKKSLFVDIGLDVQFDAGTGQLDERTVFAYSVPGLTVVGSGTKELSSGENVSANLYDLLGELIGELESDSYTYDRADALFGAFQEAKERIISAITGIGAKTSYLTFMSDRLEERQIGLKERQLDVEGIDPAEAIIHFESQKFAYSAALQMGNQILQPTVFDFMK